MTSVAHALHKNKKTMPIRNYSSKSKPTETIGKIQGLLAEHGASRVGIDYNGRQPEALIFSMSVQGTQVSFRLTVDVQGMLAAMKSNPRVPNSACNDEQAERTAWKNKYEWLHLQMAEIESGQARIEQLLLGYAVTPDGQTLFDAIKNSQMLLTGAEAEK